MIISSKEEFESIHNQTFGHISIISENNLGIPKLFCNLNGLDVHNTFDYIFDKIQKGIFIKFGDNCIDQFISFHSNKRNQWGHLIHVPKNLQQKCNFIVENNPYMWHTNNGVMRFEKPHIFHENNVETLFDMFSHLAKHRNIPKGLEVFLNKRDFPIVTTNAKYEPYYNIYGVNHEIVGKKISKMAPILSFSKRNGFDDILIPNYEDWSRQELVHTTKWNDKINKAVFRGSSTGPLKNNIRVKLCSMKNKLLDVGITKFNKRLLKNGSEMDFIQNDLELCPRMTIQEQMKYKMIIHVEGHVSAFRLGTEMSTKCCLLIVDGPWSLWFKPEPFVHFLPIKRDLSDLIQTIEWCLENDSKAEKIALNAYEFYKSFLTREKILDFLESKLQKISSAVGTYVYGPRKWNTFVERILPKFDSYNDWFHETGQCTDLKHFNYKEQLLIFFQLLAKFQHIQWHFSAYLEKFSVSIERHLEKNIVVNELYDHVFSNCIFTVHISSNKLKYVKNHVTNYTEIKHNLYDILQLFKHPVLKSINLPENLSFKEGIKFIYEKFYPLYKNVINYERFLPSPLIAKAINFKPDLEYFYKNSFPSTLGTNKLICYRQLQICDFWGNDGIRKLFLKILNCTPCTPLSYKLYNTVQGICIDKIPTNVDLTGQELPILDGWLSDDTKYIRLLYELIFNNKYMTCDDKQNYIEMFKPLLQIDKVEYSIKLARLQTVLKYNSVHQ